MSYTFGTQNCMSTIRDFLSLRKILRPNSAGSLRKRKRIKPKTRRVARSQHEAVVAPVVVAVCWAVSFAIPRVVS